MISNIPSNLLRVSDQISMDASNGTLTVKCRCGHTYEVKPVRWDPESYEGIYSSEKDFCPKCDEIIEEC